VSLDLEQLACDIDAFSEARGWRRFHDPKNLAMAMSVEVAELVEQLQWLTPEESAEHARSTAVADEVADVLIYLVRFADLAGIDLAAAVESKMRKNGVKHPPS
jgi:NTP pyrophosphatase (non-canonical NTP hydrolase)